MKSSMRRGPLALIVAALINFQQTSAYQWEVNICGLFVTQIQNDTVQTAFTRAVSAVNANRNLLGNMNVIGNPETVPKHDSFTTERTVCEKMELGMAAVFGPDSAFTSGQVEAVCDTMEVPHIQTHFNPNLNRSTCSINLHPHPDSFSSMLLRLVDAYGWKEYTILYEDDDSLLRVRALLEKYDPKGYTVTLRQLSEQDMKPMFMQLLKDKVKNIIIDCSVVTLERALRQSFQIGIMGSAFNIIVTNLDFHTLDLELYRYAGTNITGLRLVDPNSPVVQAAVERWSTDNVMEEGTFAAVDAGKLRLSSALMWDAVHLFARALERLGPVPVPSLNCEPRRGWEHGFSLLNFMKTTEIEGLTGPIRFDNQGFRTDFSLNIVELSPDEGDSVQSIGTVDMNSFNLTRLRHVKEEQDKELETVRNKTFRVVISVLEPYIMLQQTDKHRSGNDRYEGFGIDVIKELALMLGFNYTFIDRTDLGSGSCTICKNESLCRIEEDGKCTGMLREIQIGNADLAITDLTITAERANGVDFTTPFMNLGIALLHTQPQPLKPSTFSFLDPFSGEVWLCLFAAFVAVSLELYVMARLTPDEWINPYPCIEEADELENQFSMLNSFWFTTGALMQQGSEIAPIAPSTRMVAGMWWFFTLIMVSSYTANLAAFLTVTPQHEIIKEPRDLAKQDAIEYGAKYLGATYKFFRDSPDPIYKKMFSRMVHMPDNEKGVQRVIDSNGAYAFFMESSSIEYETQRECSIRQVGYNLDEKGYGIAMIKNAPYRTALSAAVVKLQESGKLSELKTRWWEQRRGGGRCSAPDDSDAKALGLANVGGVFLVMGVGVGIGALIAFCELVWNLAFRAWAGEVSFTRELWEELKFAFKCSGSTKPLKKAKTDEEILQESPKDVEAMSQYAIGANDTGASYGNGINTLTSFVRQKIHENPL